MAINLHLLRLFRTVAECRSFSRAAEALHISQPAVSKGVRELESQLGCVLVERNPGGIGLTEAGTLLLAHAVDLFAVERRAEEDLQALRGLAQGELQILQLHRRAVGRRDAGPPNPDPTPHRARGRRAATAVKGVGQQGNGA